MIFNFRRREHITDEKEKIIIEKQQQLTTTMDKDIKAFKKLNKVLSNGVTIEIKKAIGGKHG